MKDLFLVKRGEIIRSASASDKEKQENENSKEYNINGRPSGILQRGTGRYTIQVPRTGHREYGLYRHLPQ